MTEITMDLDFGEFLCRGGMHGVEERAAVAAVRREREQWLPFLEDWLAENADDDDAFFRIRLTSEIQRLRRHLGIKPTLEERRAKTLERVSGGEDAVHLARCAIRSRRAAIHGGSAYLARAVQ